MNSTHLIFKSDSIKVFLTLTFSGEDCFMCHLITRGTGGEKRHLGSRSYL